jgi:pilus assembly protein Flp/PilA
VTLATRFLQDERGATAVEYGLICACIFLVIVTAVGVFAGKTTSMYDMISSTISTAIGG